MNRYISIGQASKMLGVSIATLRRWDKEGKLLSERTPAGHRRYLASDVATFNPLGLNSPVLTRPTIAYARVSSHDQKDDLNRQIKVLEMYCASNGWSFEVISDLGSGMNYKKKGLCELLERIIDDKVGRLVLTHKDRLLRFGAELVFSVCEAKNVEVVIINQGDDRSFEEELASDVLEIVTVFSARMYGARSHKNKKLIEGVEKAVEDAENA
ncbi:MAG: IS607 family transposase [Clostridiales Family XIII bacterium]|jgi:predicted site-specific integrase-resolvase|nr:IS607 family transposase [Clostridiales Family XIII bacterium]